MLDKTLQQQSTEQDLKTERLDLKGQVVMLSQAQEELGKRFASVAKARDVAEQLAEQRLTGIDKKQSQVRTCPLPSQWPALLPRQVFAASRNVLASEMSVLLSALRPSGREALWVAAGEALPNVMALMEHASAAVTTQDTLSAIQFHACIMHVSVKLILCSWISVIRP